MGDVGNGDVEAVVAAAFFGIDGVVEVARGDAVNGDEGQVAQVKAVVIVFRLQFVGQAFAFGEDVGGEFGGDVVVFDGNVGFHAGRHGFAEDGDDFADGLPVARRVGGDFADDDLSRLAAAEFARRYEHVLGQAAVFRDEGPHAMLYGEFADDAFLCAFEDFHRRVVFAATVVFMFDAGKDFVAVHEFGHVFGRDEAVRFAAFRAEEAVAFLVGDDETGDKVHFAGDAVAALAVAHELPGTEHGFQAVLQAVGFFAVHGEGFGDLREGERFALRFQPAEDVFAAGQGVPAVFALFAGVVGVFRPPVFCVFHGDLVGLYDGSIIAHGHGCDAQKAHQAG